MIAFGLVLLPLLAQQPEPPAEVRPDALAQARALVDELRCTDAIAALTPLVGEEIAAPQRREALFLLGYCLAVSDQLTNATLRFKEAWALDLDAPQGIDVEPKVQILINGARDELLRAREVDRRAAREAKKAGVLLDATAPPQIAGGRRIPIRATLTDPQHVVSRVRLEFRPDKERDAFVLPMQRGQDGVWHGEIPGLYTRTPQGAYTIFWRVLALDDEGPLAEAGTADRPRETYVTEGEAYVPELRANERLRYGQRIAYALFGVGASVAFTGVATAGSLSLLTTLAAQTPFEGAGRGLTVFLPPFVTTAVAYAACDPLIDGPWKFLPPAIVLAFSIPGAAAAAIAPIPREGLDYVEAVGIIGAAGGTIGTVAAAIAAATLVALDPPGVVHDE